MLFFLLSVFVFTYPFNGGVTGVTTFFTSLCFGTEGGVTILIVPGIGGGTGGLEVPGIGGGTGGLEVLGMGGVAGLTAPGSGGADTGLEPFGSGGCEAARTSVPWIVLFEPAIGRTFV